MAETILPKKLKKKQKIDPEIGVGLSWKTIKNQKQLIMMSFPILIYLIIFNYVPIWGWLMAFQNYRPALKFSKQQWVGFDHFKFLIRDDVFLEVHSKYTGHEYNQFGFRLWNSHSIGAISE